MSEVSIACCVLTHNHAKIVESVIPYVAKKYAELGIDVYYIDSSDNDETKKIVYEYIEKGYDRLNYIKVENITSGDDKMLRILEQKVLPRKYDYIWPTKDRNFLYGEGLSEIISAIKTNIYDVVFGAVESDRWELMMPPMEDEYSDPTLFFERYAQLVTDWVAVIRKTETMLNPINWDEFYEQYLHSRDNNFTQPLSIFVRLAEMDSIRIRVVHLCDKDRVTCILGQSEWGKRAFEIWIEGWVKAIYSLPAIYDEYKYSAIRHETMFPILFGSLDGLFVHRRNGILTSDMFSQYETVWPLISDIPLETVYMVIDRKDDELLVNQLEAFFRAFLNKEYERAYYLYEGNRILFRCAFSEEENEILKTCFSVYRSEMNCHYYSKLFENVMSPYDVIEKYRYITEDDNWD